MELTDENEITINNANGLSENVNQHDCKSDNDQNHGTYSKNEVKNGAKERIFNSPDFIKIVLVILSFAACLEGSVVNGFFNISVTTIEKRFGLRSSESGLITSVLDIAGAIATPLVSYVGGAGHKPHWLGVGVLIMGTGSIMFSLPHFVAPEYQPVNIETFNCNATQICEETGLRSYRGFFFAGFILVGIGACPLYTIAYTYLDENVKQNLSSTFNGIYLGCSSLGPAIGFLLGGFLLSLYTTMKDPGNITETSSAWVGNWWISFLIVGILHISLSIPIMKFPKQIPGTEEYRKNRETEIHKNRDLEKVKGNEEFGKTLKDVPRCLLIVLKNPCLMAISFSSTVDSGLIIGLATFGPKYIESIYGVTASDAGLYFGALAIVGASSANFIGGYAISKYKMKVMTMLKISLVTSVIALGAFFIFFLSCKNPDIAGVIVPYSGESVVECEQTTCGCSTELYRPICGFDNLSYLSFCHAGCSVVNEMDFANCSKIATDADMNMAAEGLCKNTGCGQLPLFIVVLGVAIFCTFFTMQPTLQASMRIVPFTQRSFSVGVQWMIVRIFGVIPLPIIFGKVIDMTCLVWERRCDECGSCHVYDNNAMSTYMVLLCIVLKGISVVCIIASIYTYKTSPMASSSENSDTESQDNDDVNKKSDIVELEETMTTATRLEDL